MEEMEGEKREGVKSGIGEMGKCRGVNGGRKRSGGRGGEEVKDRWGGGNGERSKRESERQEGK